MSKNKAPYTTAEEAEEGRIRAMGFYATQVARLSTALSEVSGTIKEMEDSSFPDEYGILGPIKALERAAKIQVEPKIITFGKAYADLIADPEPEPEVPEESKEEE